MGKDEKTQFQTTLVGRKKLKSTILYLPTESKGQWH